MKNKGILFGAGAYLMWGVFPIYFKAIQNVPAMEIVFHRIAWSFVFTAVLISLKKNWEHIRPAVRSPKTLAVYLAAACLLAANWGVYVWAVNAGHVVEASLGYFINPLLSVALGVVLLREKLRLFQWIPIALAAAGVLYLTIQYGAPPWISLALATSFGLYGLVKKLSPLASLEGLTLETAILFLPALGYLIFVESQGTGSFGHIGLTGTILLAFTGVVTSLPLLLFASSARQIPLSLLGILQYIAPTCQFLLGVLLYREPFTQAQFVGFAAIWAALLMFTLESYLVSRRTTAHSPAT